MALYKLFNFVSNSAALSEVLSNLDSVFCTASNSFSSTAVKPKSKSNKLLSKKRTLERKEWLESKGNLVQID